MSQLNKQNIQKEDPPSNYKFFYIAHVFSLFFSFIALVLILTKGIPYLSSLYSQCSTYYQTKYSAKSDLGFTLFLIQLIISFVSLLIATVILAVRICGSKDLKGMFKRLKFESNIKIALYILYSVNLLSVISPIGFYLQLLRQKEQCLKNIDRQWFIILAIMLVHMIFGIICWVYVVFYLQQCNPEESTQPKQEDQAVSFAADSPTIFKPNNSQLRNNSHFFSPRLEQPPVQKEKNVKSFNFMRQELQKLKRKIVHPTQSTFQNKRTQNPTLLNPSHHLDEFTNQSNERERRYEKKHLQDVQKEFHISEQQKPYIPGFQSNPYSRLIDEDQTKRQQIKKETEIKSTQEKNVIYQRKKVSKKLLFVDEERSEQSSERQQRRVGKQHKKQFQKQVGQNLKQKFTNQQQQQT